MVGGKTGEEKKELCEKEVKWDMGGARIQGSPIRFLTGWYLSETELFVLWIIA